MTQDIDIENRIEELLDWISTNGLSVLVIDNDFFVINSFIPCDSNVNKTRVVGMNIKKLMMKATLGLSLIHI